MRDETLHSELAAGVPPVSAADVDAALARARATGHARVRRRRIASRSAPIVVAAVTAGVIVVATVGAHGGGRQATPASSTAVLPSGTWYRHVAAVSAGPTRSVDLSAVWVVHVDAHDVGSFDIRPRSRFGTGVFRYDATRRAWVVDVLGSYCGHKSGLYRVTRTGQSLLFIAVTDACGPRRVVLDNAVFAPLTNPDQLLG